MRSVHVVYVVYVGCVISIEYRMIAQQAKKAANAHSVVVFNNENEQQTTIIRAKKLNNVLSALYGVQCT